MIWFKEYFDLIVCLAVSVAILAWATWYFAFGGWPCL